uniref:Uncharacterized protein n=1 Tax=Setaria italica TaxID=4555 RepID=K3ZPN6_SETIT
MMQIKYFFFLKEHKLNIFFLEGTQHQLQLVGPGIVINIYVDDSIILSQLGLLAARSLILHSSDKYEL